MSEMLKRDVKRFLDAIEDGSVPIPDAVLILEEFDPLLAYFLLQYLREKHPITDISSGAGKRLLSMLGTNEKVKRLANAPKGEPLIGWFKDAYSYRQFFYEQDEFIDVIVDKLEG